MSASWTPEFNFHNPFISAVLICQLHAICKRQADAPARRILARCHDWHVQNEATVEANKCDTNGFVGTIHADATLKEGLKFQRESCNCAKLYRKVSSWGQRHLLLACSRHLSPHLSQPIGASILVHPKWCSTSAKLNRRLHNNYRRFPSWLRRIGCQVYRRRSPQELEATLLHVYVSVYTSPIFVCCVFEKHVQGLP